MYVKLNFNPWALTADIAVDCIINFKEEKG